MGGPKKEGALADGPKPTKKKVATKEEILAKPKRIPQNEEDKNDA